MHEIDALQVTYFVHCTEDVESVVRRISSALSMPVAPELEELEGHFGNRIVRVGHKLVRDEAASVFRRIIELLGSKGVRELLDSLEPAIDERNALYIRLDKQGLVKGEAVLSGKDPIRVRVRPRAFAVKRDPVAFYSRIVRAEREAP